MPGEEGWARLELKEPVTSWKIFFMSFHDSFSPCGSLELTVKYRTSAASPLRGPYNSSIFSRYLMAKLNLLKKICWQYLTVK